MPASSIHLILLLTVLISSTQGVSTNCSDLVSCSECILIPSCIWCSTPGFARCVAEEDVLDYFCNNQDLIWPVSKITSIVKKELNRNNQVSLHAISLKLRFGERLSFTVSVKAAENFPLDFYLLMDLSGSFQDDLATVYSLAPQLPMTLQNVSSDFRIGFGSFIDKPTLPFTSSIQTNTPFNVSGQASSCNHNICAKPYNYEHIISLTNSTKTFRSSLEGTIISTNADDPEDPLGAMLQAVVCKDLIGWRTEARKIILVITDDVLHTAGDGRLAGIVKPNDGQCHTEYNTSLHKAMYTNSLTQDYPSIQQIKEALIESGVVPIFAISNSVHSELNVTYLYNQLAQDFDGFIEKLTTDSNNLIDVIEDATKQAASRIKLSFSLPLNLQFNITPSCPHDSSLLDNGLGCANVSENQTVDFKIEISLAKCSQDIMERQKVKVSVPGFGYFDIFVESLCSCDCDNETIHHSANCSSNGDFACGSCTCDNGWTGTDCSCSTNDCPLGPNGIMCSGRGQCECGHCLCYQPNNTVSGISNPRIVGSTCECSNYECNTDSNGLVCSGRGRCTCSNGQYSCQCDNSTLTGIRHSGDACQCSYDHCVDPNNRKAVICNDKGTCDPCQVNKGQACTCNNNYIGQYCSIRISEDLECSGHTECILCYGKASNQDIETNICPSFNCSNYKLLLLNESVTDDYQIPYSIEDTTIQCELRSGECWYTYYQALDNEGRNVFKVEPANCLLLPFWGIGLLIGVCCIILGIICLCSIKLCIIALDYHSLKEGKATCLFEPPALPFRQRSAKVVPTTVTHNIINHFDDSNNDREELLNTKVDWTM